jgi:hypothetical protein
MCVISGRVLTTIYNPLPVKNKPAAKIKFPTTSKAATSEIDVCEMGPRESIYSLQLLQDLNTPNENGFLPPPNDAPLCTDDDEDGLPLPPLTFEKGLGEDDELEVHEGGTKTAKNIPKYMANTVKNDRESAAP